MPECRHQQHGYSGKLNATVQLCMIDIDKEYCRIAICSRPSIWRVQTKSEAIEEINMKRKSNEKRNTDGR